MMDGLRSYFWKTVVALKVVKSSIGIAMWLSKHHVVEVYDSKRRAPTVQDYIADTSEIWLSLFDGTQAEKDNLLSNPKVRKILFPCPEHNTLLQLHARVLKPDGDGQNFASDIRRRTETAIENGIEVKWVDHATSESMVIINPPTEKNWDVANSKILMSLYLPYLDTGGRPQFEITSKHERLFADMLKSFNETWKKAHKPQSD